MRLFKSSKLSGIISFIMVIFVVILLIYLVKNNWNFQAAVKDILGLFGSAKGG